MPLGALHLLPKHWHLDVLTLDDRSQKNVRSWMSLPFALKIVKLLCQKMFVPACDSSQAHYNFCATLVLGCACVKKAATPAPKFSYMGHGLRHIKTWIKTAVLPNPPRCPKNGCWLLLHSSQVLCQEDLWLAVSMNPHQANLVLGKSGTMAVRYLDDPTIRLPNTIHYIGSFLWQVLLLEPTILFKIPCIEKMRSCIQITLGSLDWLRALFLKLPHSNMVSSYDFI